MGLGESDTFFGKQRWCKHRFKNESTLRGIFWYFKNLKISNINTCTAKLCCEFFLLPKEKRKYCKRIFFKGWQFSKTPTKINCVFLLYYYPFLYTKKEGLSKKVPEKLEVLCCHLIPDLKHSFSRDYIPSFENLISQPESSSQISISQESTRLRNNKIYGRHYPVQNRH